MPIEIIINYFVMRDKIIRRNLKCNTFMMDDKLYNM